MKMMYITYKTEKYLNAIKKRKDTDTYYNSYSNMLQNLAIAIWDEIFSSCGFYGGTLKELEAYLGFKLDNSFQINVGKYFESYGICGIEYATDRNVRYVGTNDLHHVNIEDFNKFVLQAAKW